MAEVAALELQIGANVDQAVSGMKQFEKSLFQLQNELKTFKAAQETTLDPKQYVQYGQKITAVTKQITERVALMERATQEASGAVKGLGQPIGQTSQQMLLMTKSSSSATNSLFALSGIVQDAPFGFRAIANNIQFFSQQMAYTAKTAGGFGAALKAMAGAFLGPAGIIFAISAATSLLSYLFNNTKKTKDETDELTISVGNLADAMAKGSQNAVKSTTHLDLLYKAATNANKSMGERLAAVKALQAEYPSYLGNQSQEAILTGKAADAYYNLRNQILATARAKAAQSIIIDNEKQRLKLEAKLQDLGAKGQVLDANITAETARAVAASQNSTNGMNSEAIMVGILSKKRTDLNDKIKTTVDQYNKLTAANLKLIASVNVKDLTTNTGEKPGGVKGAKTKGESQGILVRRAAFNVNNALATTRASYAAFTAAASNGIGNTISSQFVQIGKAVQSVQPLLSQAQIKFEQFQTRLENGMAAANDAIRNGLNDAISNVAQGFASGGFAGAASALLNSLGDIAIQLGKIAIGVGVGVEGIRIALKSLNPIAAIAAGVGLIAIGALAKASVKNLAFADGGVVYGPTQALIGEYSGARSNPEIVAPLSKLKDILGNAGGGRNQHITADFRIQGSDLVALTDKIKRKQNRRG